MTPTQKRNSKNDLALTLMGNVKISDHNIRELEKAAEKMKNRAKTTIVFTCKEQGKGKFNIEVT